MKILDCYLIFFLLLFTTSCHLVRIIIVMSSLIKVLKVVFSGQAKLTQMHLWWLLQRQLSERFDMWFHFAFIFIWLKKITITFHGENVNCVSSLCSWGRILYSRDTYMCVCLRERKRKIQRKMKDHFDLSWAKTKYDTCLLSLLCAGSLITSRLYKECFLIPVLICF